MTGRFEDPLVRLYALASADIHVVCPRCGARALSTARGTGYVTTTPRLLFCRACAHAATWSPADSPTRWGGSYDPFFGVPLWLRAQCCGGRTLWAFNEDHLDLLEGYVAAGLRERRAEPGSMSLLARLPAWIKVAKHRDEVLRTIRRLRATLG